MITRVVKLTFTPENTTAFLDLFHATKERIASFEGCLRLELQRHTQQPHIFFTLSRWESEAALEKYRQSELFAMTWAKTKALFGEKAEAWSLNAEFDSLEMQLP